MLSFKLQYVSSSRKDNFWIIRKDMYKNKQKLSALLLRNQKKVENLRDLCIHHHHHHHHHHKHVVSITIGP
jgi:hypothetical protein